MQGGGVRLQLSGRVDIPIAAVSAANEFRESLLSRKHSRQGLHTRITLTEEACQADKVDVDESSGDAFPFGCLDTQLSSSRRVGEYVRSILILWLSAWYSNVTVTQYVDDVEPLLAANRDAYVSGPHTIQRQQVALQYFDQSWAWLKSSSACGSKLLKQSGQACLSDRSRSGSWPWETYYRDPIAATPTH